MGETAHQLHPVPKKRSRRKGTDPTNGYKWCIGTLSQGQTKLQQAFTKISDDTISIVLVKRGFFQ
jgi:hypothetical protein